jgi:hypothetical protein
VIDREVLERASDLFNRKLYFECHDILEEAWSEARGEDRAFLQSLIHLSVGLYHLAAGNHAGAKSLLERGLEGVSPFLPERDGLDLSSLVERARRCLRKTERALSGEKIEWEPADVPRMNVAGVE